MTLRDELVKLFREHRICSLCANNLGTLKDGIHTHYVQNVRFEEPCPIPHLADLAVERVELEIHAARLDEQREHNSHDYLNGGPHADYCRKCARIAALGKVKRGE